MIPNTQCSRKGKIVETVKKVVAREWGVRGREGVGRT